MIREHLYRHLFLSSIFFCFIFMSKASKHSPLRVAIGKSNPNYDDICIHNPAACAHCELFDKHCGKEMYQLFRFYIGHWLNRPVKFIPCDGNAIGEPNSTVSLLNEGKADISVAYLTITYDRAKFLKYSFPMWMTKYTAVVYAPPAQEKTLDFSSVYGKRTGAIYAILVTSICFYIFLQVANYPKQNSVLNWFHQFNWIIINVFIAYAGSIVTIAFYAPAESPLPFENFKQLADGMLAGRFKGLYHYDITRRNIFVQEGDSGILATFNRAYKINPPRQVTIDEGMKLVLSNQGYVFLTAEEPILVNIRNSYCGFLEIKDKDDLKDVLHGFYMSKDSGIAFDWYQRHVLTNAFDILVKVSYHNASHRCFKALPSESVNLSQINSLFVLLIVTLGACCFAFLLEAVFSFMLYWLSDGTWRDFVDFIKMMRIQW